MKAIQNNQIFKQIKMGASVAVLALCAIHAHAAPPYQGTVYVAPNTLTANDPSAYLSTQYIGNDGTDWLFAVAFNDGLSVQVHVSNDFTTQALARKEVDKISRGLGQLPLVNRRELEKVYVAAGVGRAYAVSAKRSFYLMAQSNDERIKQGNLEQLLLHESTHTALDPYIAHSKAWIAAQNRDNAYISTYARDNHTREDVAETFSLYLAYRYKRDRLTAQEIQNIERTMSARIAFLDSLNLDVHPYAPVKEGSGFVLTPAPRSMLSPNEMTFTFKGTEGVNYYDVLVGTQGPGSDNIRSSAVQSSPEFNVQNLPSSGGGTVYVRLWTHKNGWTYKDYTYEANRPSYKAELTSHTNNAVLTSSTVTFKWDKLDGVGDYDLLVGTDGVGSTNILASNVSQEASRVVNNIPLNGGTVYVRLWTNEVSWGYVDYSFSTANGAVAPPAPKPVAPKPVAPKPAAPQPATSKPAPKPASDPSGKTFGGIQISERLYNILKRMGWI